MLLKDLRTAVLEANLEIVRRGLVLYTFGNASGVDREQGLMVIKPSGVDYDDLRPEHMVVTDLQGTIVDGALKPSSDLDTHTLLYREFPSIGAIVHTHSEFATSFAQAGLSIPALGTTHADYFYGAIPCTVPLSDEACGGRYVHETGVAIVQHFQNNAIDPLAVPACLVAGHAPFVWGKDAHDAAHNAVVLEAVAKMAYKTLTLVPGHPGVSQALLDRHYFRKHGATATYGQ
ncbi:L-ribulose-5-phosphate 4-epimerase [Granulicella sp. dw_53]|uniref:L-ribulose-5-phosphate 4-epimerase n=1 Tax=Granulicella sp. dw_53 TaxID=2719792 RepID=UPI0023DEBAF9|nr:L-ribulose-5-phosphate 4-epimerase [Granulicella sp. dw_53]